WTSSGAGDRPSGCRTKWGGYVLGLYRPEIIADDYSKRCAPIHNASPGSCGSASPAALACEKPPTRNEVLMNKNKLSVALSLLAAVALVGAPAARAAEPYIPVISKGFQHQFWQAVKMGSEKAAKDYKVKINFEGPEN